MMLLLYYGLYLEKDRVMPLAYLHVIVFGIPH